MTQSITSKAAELVASHIAAAREFARRGDTVLRDQTIRDIEAIPGLSRAEIKKAQAAARANPVETARRLGQSDGQTAANEGREDGSYRSGGSSDWDASLINAVGNAKTRELFGLFGDASPAEDDTYTACLHAYSEAATKAYDAEHFGGWTITEFVSADGILTGNEERIKVRESVDQYAEMLAAAIEKKFPGADISVTVGQGRCLCVGPNGEDITMEVGEIARDLHESGRWAVYTDDDAPAPMLHDYYTAKEIRPATAEEREDSIEAAKHDGGAGVISVDGRSCYVVD